MIIGAIPFGIIFGALAISAGLSVPATLAMSLFVFAGSSQFVAAGLVAQGAGILIIILTTFVVNLRHGLYSASLGPYVRHLSQRWLLPLAFWLTDESYAVVIRRYERADTSPNKHWYYLGSCVAMYGNWQLCTLIGIITGTRLQGLADMGLEFAMVVTFIGIVIPLLVNAPMVLCALVAGSVSLLCRDWPNQLGLMAGALSGMTCGYLSTRIRRSTKALTEETKTDDRLV